MSNLSNFLSLTNKSGDSKLHLAARNGSFAPFESFLAELTAQFGKEECKTKAQELLQHHCNKYGKTVLHETAQNSHKNVVEWLLEVIKMEPNCYKQGDWSPLMLACTKGRNLEIVQLIVNAGGDLKLKNKDGWTAFHIACREGSIDIVEFLYNKGPTSWNCVSKNGRTPLHTAAMFGRWNVVDFLLSLSVYPVDQADVCGCTPLMDALRFDHVDIAELLIQRQKVDINKREKLGRHSIHIVAEANAIHSMDFLIKQLHFDCNMIVTQSAISPLHFAAKEGHINMVEKLFDFGADTNAVCIHGRTALHLAVTGQHSQCVEFLLKNGCQKDLADTQGHSARYYAKKDHIKMLFDAIIE